MEIFDLLEKINAMDKNNDYLVTKIAGDYVIVRINLPTDERYDIAFANTERRLRITLEGIYDEVKYHSERDIAI